MFDSWNYLPLDTNHGRDFSLASPGNVLSPVLVQMNSIKYPNLQCSHTCHAGTLEGHFSHCFRLALSCSVGFTPKIIQLQGENPEIRFSELIQN